MKNLLTCLFLFFFINGYSQSFNKVDLATMGTVIISQGGASSVSGGAPKSTRIENNTLYIEGNDNAEYNVNMKEIEMLSISGNGEIKSSETLSSPDLTLNIGGNGKMVLALKVTELRIDIGGVGKMDLSGTAENAGIKISGSGKVDAFNLKVQNCKANLSGVGKCDIDVVKSLRREVGGMGSVNYKTKPESVSDEGSDASTETEHSAKMDKGDTTHFKWGQSDVYLVKNDSLKKAHKEKQTKTRPIWSGIEIGLNNYYNLDGKMSSPPSYDYLELNAGKSVSFSLNLLQKNIRFGKSNFWFFTGLGITWNNYRFDNNVYLSTNSHFIMGGRDTVSTNNYIKSKLTTSYLMAPVMLELFTSRKYKHAFHLGAGAMLGYRIGSHTKQKYTNEGKTYKPKVYDDFYLNPFRYGLRVAAGYGKFNVFADYYYSTLFSADKGPTLNPVNIGVTLVPF